MGHDIVLLSHARVLPLSLFIAGQDSESQASVTGVQNRGCLSVWCCYPHSNVHDPQGHFSFKPTKPGEAQTFLRTLTAKLETDMQAFGADLAEEESRDDELLSTMLASQKRHRCSTLFEYVRSSSNANCHIQSTI